MGSTNPRRSCPNSSVGSMGAPSLVSCGRSVYVAHQRVIVTRGEAWKLWQVQASGTVGLSSHWGKGCVGGVCPPWLHQETTTLSLYGAYEEAIRPVAGR